jgi:hypothetical protein
LKYRIKTPSEFYNGETEGVVFTEGHGETEDKNIRNILVNDYGYEEVKAEAKPKKAKPSDK